MWAYLQHFPVISHSWRLLFAGCYMALRSPFKFNYVYTGCVFNWKLIKNPRKGAIWESNMFFRIFFFKGKMRETASNSYYSGRDCGFIHVVGHNKFPFSLRNHLFILISVLWSFFRSRKSANFIRTKWQMCCIVNILFGWNVSLQLILRFS